MRKLVALATATAALVLVPAPAHAADSFVVAVPGSLVATYATPVTVADPGGTLTLVNLDIDEHNVVQDVNVDGSGGPDTSPWCGQFASGSCPLFWSPRAALGETAAVEGLANLSGGAVYSFYCTVHPGMKGKLIALPDA